MNNCKGSQIILGSLVRSSKSRWVEKVITLGPIHHPFCDTMDRGCLLNRQTSAGDLQAERIIGG